jgi:hypothetical protein
MTKTELVHEFHNAAGGYTRMADVCAAEDAPDPKWAWAELRDNSKKRADEIRAEIRCRSTENY